MENKNIMDDVVSIPTVQEVMPSRMPQTEAESKKEKPATASNLLHTGPTPTTK